MASRAVAPAVAQPARTAEPGRSHTRVQRSSLRISNPGDAAEREAESTARTVMAMPAPAVAPRERVSLLAARAPSAAAPKARNDETSPELTAEIRSQLGGGRPLPAETRSFLEPRFKANFAGVRIHTGGKAENLSTRLGARAFTHGRDIFFNAGAFQPDSPQGMELIAHELTHTIQQQEVVQREVEVSQKSSPKVQRGIVSEALDWIADKANYIPGFRLFTIVIGRNPINMSRVERSGANILRALIEFIPGGGLIVDALENHGVIQKGGKFIEDQFAALGDLGAALRDALMEFIDSLGWRDIFRLGSLWGRAKRIFSVPVDKAIAFGKGLVSGIATLVKDAILKPLGRWAARNIPYFDMLAGVFGKNPISDEGESPASALIGKFMNLIGQGEIWENIKKGNAVGKAWTWFKDAMGGALSLVTSIPGRVMSTIRSLTIFDIVTLVGAFKKVLGAFASFVKDFIGWAGKQVLSLLEIILSVVAPTMVPYLKKAGAAFKTIIQAPGRFIGTLVRAGKLGFNMFKNNIVKHLRDALFKWLLGSAEGAGVYFPQSFAPRELLKMGLSVLGLTWANLRGKLVTATNETTVKALETGFDLVKTLVKDGPAAAWQQLLETLSNLKTMVVDAAIDFVKGEVVRLAIEKLVSFLTPAGAFIQAIISIYRTISFIVTKLAEIGRVVAAFIDGIAAIAAGVVAPAATRVENVLATGMSLAISFLANFAGLGNIPKKVMEIIKKIRAPVDKAMDKVVTWVVTQARKVGTMVLQAGVPSDPAKRTQLAIRDAKLIAKGLGGKPITKGLLDTALAVIKTRYSLSSLDVYQKGAAWWGRAKINPETADELAVESDDASLDPQAIWEEVVAGPDSPKASETRLTPVSATNARRQIVAIFASRNVPASAADTALKAIDSVLKAALAETTGDGITNRMASVAGIANAALAQGNTGTVLNAHHVQQVAPNKATFPATGTKRQNIPREYKRAITAWERQQKKAGVKNLQSKKEELVGLLRQQLFDSKVTSTRKPLTMVDIIIATAQSHRAAHSAMARAANAEAALRITAPPDPNMPMRSTG